MKIDSAIQNFMESYDEQAIHSIDVLSKDFTYNATKTKFDTFNINESFEGFQQYLKGYAKYKSDNIGNPKASPQTAIVESCNNFVDQLIKPTKSNYSELNQFVESYLKGVQSTVDTVNEVITFMTESDVDVESIGLVSDLTDRFFDRITESFNPVMENLLLVSGYKEAKRQEERLKEHRKNPVFL